MKRLVDLVSGAHPPSSYFIFFPIHFTNGVTAALNLI